MRFLISHLQFLLLLSSYYFSCHGFFESLIQNQNPRKADLFSSAINEIFGAIEERPKQQQQIFVEKRGVEEEEDGGDQSGGDGGGIGGLLGGGPGGNAAIVCPSGNRVYVHPISGDLQQCSQQLGFYNQTTCPGGTVCERFPILIPGFQDYCCWGNDTSESEILTLGTTEMSIIDNISGPDSSGGFVGGISGGGNGIGGYTESPQPSTTESENSDESEWIPATTTAAAKTKRTRRPRPRSRKTGSTTTETPTTTTTLPPRTPPPRRGPRCDNPDDAALIDFGNRLRDCYYQQCPYNYRCEFNTDIRRYICCGKERDVFPPPGLPPLPEPQPVVPRPFRPRMPPPYLHGEEVENPLSQTSSSSLALLGIETNDQGDNHITENICPLGHEHRGFLGGISFCEAGNLNLICPVTHPYCVHSKTWGATVCCSTGNTEATTSDE